MKRLLHATFLCSLFIGLSIATSGVLATDVPLAPKTRTLNLPEVPHPYTKQKRPDYLASTGLATFDVTPADNPLTDAGATLGRVLFYDTRLSANHMVSCGSCHVQQHAFADPRPVSVGFSGRKMDRNSMALNDLRYVRAGFFWDERAETLEEAVLQPIFSHVEMGLDPTTLVDRLSSDQYYPRLFKQAFGNEEVTVTRVAQALSQFVRGMESNQSKYDAAVAAVSSSREDFPGFTDSENLGKRIFFDRCVACHHLGTEPKVAIFAMFRSLNNGIDPDGTVRDGGRGDITFDPSEVGSFKASSLRNVEYTAPYMHDGRLATLEDVIEHYSTGVNRHPNLGPVSRFQFSNEEKTALVDFLKTLSDPHFVVDPRFSDPWETVPPPSLPVKELVETPSRNLSDSNEIEDLQLLLDQAQGLPANATLIWLRHLDTDGDGALSKAEAEPVVSILQRIGGITPRSRTRSAAALAGRGAPSGGPPQPVVRPGRTEPHSTSAPPGAIPATNIRGDFDGDGHVSEQEAATYQALSRFIELAGGGRLEVFLDRLVGRFDFTPEQQQIARQRLKGAKVSLIEEGRRQDLALCNDLAQTLGPEGFRAFQSRVVDRLAEVRTASPTEPFPRSEADRLIWEHDKNQNGVLDSDELPELARTLASAPGGFGQLPPAGVDIGLFATRILQFDEDGDRAVSPQELPERMRFFAIDGDRNRDGRLDAEELRDHLQVVAFERIVLTGIYVGGGFANTLVSSRQALDEIELPEEVRSQAVNLIVTRDTLLKKQVSESLETQFQFLQQLAHGDNPAEISPQRSSNERR